MRPIHIEPKVEGRSMTKRQWKDAHREARILTKNIQLEIALSADRITKYFVDCIRYGKGVMRHANPFQH